MDIISQVWPEWVVGECIGAGSYGTVWHAVRTVAGYTSHSAIKVIEIPRGDDETLALLSMGMDEKSISSYYEETARSLIREVEVLESLKGTPGIVSIDDYKLAERENGKGWVLLIRMELLESLALRVQREGIPSPQEVAKIGVDLCQGLSFCHALGVIHRDVKPANVFRNRFGKYKLGDFGIAGRLADATRTTMTRVGSPSYMAPEVFSGHYDESVDVYSLGVMLYRWLNGGRPPFVAAEGPVVRSEFDFAERRRLSGERPPLPAGEGVDPELAATVRRAVEPVSANRWPSASAFGETLQKWLTERRGHTERVGGLAELDDSTVPVFSQDAVHAAPVGERPSFGDSRTVPIVWGSKPFDEGVVRSDREVFERRDDAFFAHDVELSDQEFSQTVKVGLASEKDSEESDVVYGQEESSTYDALGAIDVWPAEDETSIDIESAIEEADDSRRAPSIVMWLVPLLVLLIIAAVFVVAESAWLQRFDGVYGIGLYLLCMLMVIIFHRILSETHSKPSETVDVKEEDIYKLK